jgi:sporulation protein YlmC with PRC-barrel domain
MSTNGFPVYDASSMVVRPLTELPTLRLADAARDVRGWEVIDRDGRRLGTVVDLLVDIDRLEAETLLVSPGGGDRAEVRLVVPLRGLSPDQGGTRRLVAGEGMPPIGLRYQSTTHYAIWVTIAVVIMALAGWVLGFFE